MRKSDRLFQLTNVLRRQQPLTARQLAQILQVSERTIYRYVDDLSLAGIPLYGEPGVGYRLLDGFELPPLQLSPDELAALIAGVNFTVALTGEHFAAAARSLLAKIEAALPDQTAAVRPVDAQRVVRVPVNRQQSPAGALWQSLHQAIERQQWLQLSYHSLADQPSNRLVLPLGLFYWGGKWTVGCWCALRGQYRDLRLDRITGLSVAAAADAVPPSVSLTDYLQVKTAQPY